jgi:hypothetical protein
MKKGILIFAVALLFVAFIPRPVAAAVNIDLGIKGGMSLASYKWSDDTSASKSLTSPVFGVFAAFNFGKTFAIQPEVYWLTLGGKDINDESIDVYEYRMLLNYIHVPVLAKVHLIKEGKYRPVVFAGPAVGFLMTAKQKFYLNGVLEDDMDIKPFLKSTNFSAVFGAGLEVAMNKLMLALDVRYDMGLTDINNKGTDALKLKALMFMLGVGF